MAYLAIWRVIAATRSALPPFNRPDTRNVGKTWLVGQRDVCMSMQAGAPLSQRLQPASLAACGSYQCRAPSDKPRGQRHTNLPLTA